MGCVFIRELFLGYRKALVIVFCSEPEEGGVGPMKKQLCVVFLFFLIVFVPFQAGESAELQALEEILKTPSPTGYEEGMIQTILKLLPDESMTERDGMGSLYALYGEGRNLLALLTGIDEIGYVVSGFNEEGYLHLFRAVSSPHALYDSYQFGHPLTVWTENGPVSGVLTLPSLHTATRELRNNLQNLFVIENALVDIGARSEAEAREKGILMLDPVTPLARITTLAGGQKSAPSLGIKVCSSILVDLASAMEPIIDDNAVVFAWLAQSKFPARRSRPRASLGAVVAKGKLAASSYLVIDSYPIDPQAEGGISIGGGPVLVTAGENESALSTRILQIAASENLSLQRIDNSESMIFSAFSAEMEAAGLFIPLKFPATPNEIVDFGDVEILLELVSRLLQ